MSVKIGVLAIQGDFLEHEEVLKRLKAEAVAVRLPEDLEDLHGLIIPGGESTTIGRLLHEYKLVEAIKAKGGKGLAIFATCAGMILLAKKADGLPFPPLALLDIEVQRNAYGRQLDSFETDIDVPVLRNGAFHAVFIRAPIIQKVGPQVEVLARLDNKIIAVRQGKIMAAAFHPELTRDLRFHAYFINSLVKS